MLAGEVFPLLAGGKPLVAISYAVATTSLVVQNLRSFLIGQGLWNGTDAINLTFTVPAGKSVWSNNKSYPAMLVRAVDFPEDSIITIVNQGLICGKGDWSPAGGAIQCDCPVFINNTGSINGGGYCAGGAAGHYCANVTHDYSSDACGTCCVGCTSGSGGTGYGYGYSSAGSAHTAGGTGASCGGASYGCGTDGSETCYCATCSGGAGGVGGGAGSSGYCVSGNGFVTWLATGTRNGSIS